MKKYALALPEGSVLGGRYIVGKVLGQGGFGITYIARDYTTKELVAIKEFFPSAIVTRTEKVTVSLISSDENDSFTYGKDSFLKEAETLARFNKHPNIVHIYSYFEENNTAYLVMEYLDGESFLDYLKHKGRISWAQTRRIINPVMDALSFVHSQGIIHRDISPDNIYLCKDGTVKLIDFGAARYSLGDRSHSLSVVLKHGYAPHEQYTRRGRQGPYTDVYALAATMYRAVTGKLPPEAPDRMYEDELVMPSALGADMSVQEENALLKALAFNYVDRWQTIAEFKSALDRKSAPDPGHRDTVKEISNPEANRINSGYDRRGSDFDRRYGDNGYYDNRRPAKKGKMIAIIACISAAVIAIATTLIVVISCNCAAANSPAQLIKGTWRSSNGTSTYTIVVSDDKLVATETASDGTQEHEEYTYEVTADNKLILTMTGQSATFIFTEINDTDSLANSVSPFGSSEAKWFVNDKYFVMSAGVLTKQ